MKRLTMLSNQLRGLTHAITRYPLTAAFFLSAAVINTITIHTGESYINLILACVVGAVLCVALQAAYERFFNKSSARLLLMGIGIALTLAYYLIIKAAPELSEEIGIRTLVALLALFFAYIWLPVIRSKISFNESFMAAFKSFFHSIFYSAVIFGGCSLIISAIDLLIVDIPSKAYAHTANIVFIVFAPLFFLSLIPIYPRKRDAAKNTEPDDIIERAAFCPRFLEVLISYIIIPLTAIFTVILLLYILLNIQGSFWTNNLLEPMLVSYSITIIIVYILASRLQNKFAALFRLIFPKVLIPIVVFQIASSIMNLRETGITHTRYFVILFGIFSACAGVVMSVVPVQKNGILAAMLIAFSAISIIPPVDAFTVSRMSQENMLKNVLVQNSMLKDNAIIPNSSIKEEDKKKIVSSVEYLSMMQYTNKVVYMPKDFHVYEDFYNTFGFEAYGQPEHTRYVTVYLKPEEPINIAGYDVLTRTSINLDETSNSKISDIEKAGVKYTLKKEKKGKQYGIILRGSSDEEIIRFSTDEIFSRYLNKNENKSVLSTDEATFTTENDKAKLAVVVQNSNMNISSSDQAYYNAEVYVLVAIK